MPGARVIEGRVLCLGESGGEPAVAGQPRSDHRGASRPSCGTPALPQPMRAQKAHSRKGLRQSQGVATLTQSAGSRARGPRPTAARSLRAAWRPPPRAH